MFSKNYLDLLKNLHFNVDDFNPRARKIIREDLKLKTAKDLFTFLTTNKFSNILKKPGIGVDTLGVMHQLLLEAITEANSTAETELQEQYLNKIASLERNVTDLQNETSTKQSHPKAHISPSDKYTLIHVIRIALTDPGEKIKQNTNGDSDTLREHLTSVIDKAS